MPPMPTPLIERLREHARCCADAIAYREITTDGGRERQLSYGELWHRAEALAKRLTPGQVVLIRLPNRIEFPVAFLGTRIAGCIAFPVSTDSAEAELVRACEVAGVDVIVDEGGHPDALCVRGSSGHSGSRARVENPCHGGLFLQSSGTTGLPKIVHRGVPSIDAVADQMCRSIGLRQGDRVLATIPLCHSYGLEHGLLAPLAAGATVHLCPFDLSIVLRQLADGGITIFPGVPSIYEMLAQLAEAPTRLPCLRSAYSAGAPLPRAVFDAFDAAFGVRIGQLYGATEVGSVTYSDPCAKTFDPASVGVAMEGVEIRIASAEDPALPLPPNTEGQVCIRARSMFNGYVGDDSSPLVDGFFPTADLGRLDEHGNLTITGRLKLLIDVGGLKVNPMEVETVLLQHPAVSACVIVPIRQSQTVYRLKAVIVARNPADPPDVEDLRRFARDRLTSYKVPRVFELRASLPRSSTGKVLRHRVQA